MGFHDSVKKNFFFQNTKISDISPQIIHFKNLDDSVVIFQALQTSAASLTSMASVTSLASTASKAIFPQKDFLVLMVWSSQAPKWPILVIFCRMDHQKSNFLLIYGTSFYRRLLRTGYVIFLKTFWWNSNAQTSGTYRYLHYNLKVVFSWPPRSSKSVNMSWNTL